MRHALPVLLLIVALASPAGARAQSAQSPSGGMWWSVSAAAGGARLSCNICDPTRDAGPAVEGAIGTYASPAVRVGVDGGWWTFREDDFREQVMSAGVVAEVHPRRGSGLHLIGGLGWSGYRANDTDPAPDQEGFSYDALRLRLGAGWDLPLTSSWSVGNRVTLDASSLGTLKDEDTPIARAVGLSVVRIAIYLRHN
ncbi:MAG: hypothetical protein ABL963_03560 [Longimicrobiales bacterium]